MPAQEAKVLELVVFQLTDGVTRDELLATVDPVSRWAAEQPGFVSRDLVHDAEHDRWIDVVWWRSMEDAHAAAEAAMHSPSCAPMFALIDEKETLMLHGERAIAPFAAAA